MQNLKDEIKVRFEKFTSTWQPELQAVINQLAGSEPAFFESYLRIVSLNVWRTDLLSQIISPGSLAFFLEGQNDALVSHVFARMGAWRSALKSLRGLLENVVFGLYFKDHPVELMLWNQGKFKPGFSSTIGYLKGHPALGGISPAITGLDVFVREYATLSKAVHGSVPFQMTAGTGSTSLSTSSVQSLGKWRTHEKQALLASNLVLLTVFRDELQGAKQPQLRKAISFAVPNATHPAVKAELGIVLSPAP